MTDTIYQLSEKRFIYTKRMILILGLLLPVLLAIFMIVSLLFEDSLNELLVVYVPVIVLIELIVFGVYNLVVRQLRLTKFLISSQFVERSSGKTFERIAYREIKKIQVYETPEGKAITAIIYSDKSTFMLGGVSDLDGLLSQLAQNIGNQTRVERKTVKTKFPTWLFIGLGLAIGLAIPTFASFWGREGFDVFGILFFLLFGLYSLIYKPIRKSLGGRFANFEVIIGFLLILISIALIVIRTTR